MPPTPIQYGGRYDLPLPPPEQPTVDTIITLEQLQLFEYPPVDLNPFELWSFIERQWKLRKALLQGVQRSLTQAQSAEDVHSEFLPVPAGVLYWLGSFERWMRLSFLSDVFENPTEAHDLLKEEGQDERAFILGSLGQLYDHMFKTLCDFFVEIHYTDELDEIPTDLPLTECKVYVASTDVIISATSKTDCKITERQGSTELLWWDQRRLILEQGPNKREGVCWLLQDKEYMEELTERYPVPEMLSRRPFMMPAIQFR
jgi:hypothetical protein